VHAHIVHIPRDKRVTRASRAETRGRPKLTGVGRAGIRRRKAVRHLPKIESTLDLRAFGPEHSPYTVEGRIEAVGRLARGMRDASPAQMRFLGRLFAACIGFLVVVGTAMWLFGRIFA